MRHGVIELFSIWGESHRRCTRRLKLEMYYTIHEEMFDSYSGATVSYPQAYQPCLRSLLPLLSTIGLPVRVGHFKTFGHEARSHCTKFVR
jgi:hypothetical protein